MAVNQEEFKKKLGIPVSGKIDPGYINAVSSGSNYTVPMAKSSVNSSNKKKATNPIAWSPTGTLYNYPGNYNSPNYTPISREAALSQAMSELEPLIQRMRNTAIQQYQDYRNRIPDMINARAGTPLGGPRVIAEADLADEQARALSDIDLSGLAQALALAREIHAQDTRRADALENQAYQRWLDSARMSMDAYKTDLGQRNIDRSFGLQELIANRDYELGLGSLDLSRLAEERARKSQEFDFERYFKSPEAQDWYLPLTKQQIEAGIAATNRSNRPQPSQPREVKPETSINHRATQSAVAGVWDYDTPEEALEAYGYYAGDMAANGVDLSKVWGEMIRRWPNYSAFNNNTFIGGGLATD